ncbi:succinate dehydrogenase assembly factor 2 [Candidatus Pelagibacter sp.]|nr:succinate dehydrogenase assembly factor 2 [Candidatus Pelagibacter sp.]
MDFDIEYLKKKIIYRSNYRGTKEMDKLLGAFTNEYINQLNNEDLLDLQNLLDIEDEDLYNFYKGLNTNKEFKKNNVNLLFKNFKYKTK